MASRRLFPIIALLSAPYIGMPLSAIAQESPPHQIDAQKLEEMQRRMRNDIFPYADLDQYAPAPQDAAVFIEFLVETTWAHGMPRQLLEVVDVDPTHFAPVIRERLMHLPPTFEDYLLDLQRTEHQYSISSTRETRPMGPESGRLLMVVERLDRASAEPILREFFDHMHPLVVEARRRYWNAQDATAVDGKTGRATEAWHIWTRLSAARGHALIAATKLQSSIFVDDILSMLDSNDAAERTAGADIGGYYIPHFANERPDALKKLQEAADTMKKSDNPREASAAHSLQERLDKAMGSD